MGSVPVPGGPWNHRPPRSLDLTAYIFSFLDVCTKITSALSISMGLREVPGFGRRKNPHKQRVVNLLGDGKKIWLEVATKNYWSQSVFLYLG